MERSKQEMEYILNKPLTIRHLILIGILYVGTRILESNPEYVEEIIRMLGLGPLLLGK